MSKESDIVPHHIDILNIVNISFPHNFGRFLGSSLTAPGQWLYQRYFHMGTYISSSLQLLHQVYQERFLSCVYLMKKCLNRQLMKYGDFVSMTKIRPKHCCVAFGDWP